MHIVFLHFSLIKNVYKKKMLFFFSLEPYVKIAVLG